MSMHPHDFPDDLANPYAAPMAEIGAKFVDVDAEILVPLEPGAILSYAYQVGKERMGLTLGAVVVPVGLGQLFQLTVNRLLTPMQAGPPANFLLAAVAVILAGFAFQTWLTLGQTIVLLKIAQRRPVSFGEIFSGSPFFLRAVGGFLITYLVLLAIALVCFLPAVIIAVAMRGNQTAIVAAFVVAGIVALVGWIITQVRLSQFQYLIIDRNMGVIEALKTSAEITRGNVITIIGVGLLGGLVVLCGLLACGVGLIVAGPLVALMMAVTYLALVGASKAASFQADDFLPERKPAPENDFDGVL